MKIFLAVLLAIPMSCYGMGPDSCWLEGKIKGRIVTLGYGDDDHGEGIYGLGPNGVGPDAIYGYCHMGAKGEHQYVMSCSPVNDSKQIIYYETLKGNGFTYLCKTGCTKNIVKKFTMKCGDD